MDAVMKWLVADYAVFQLLAIRGMIVLPLLFLWVLGTERGRPFLPTHFSLVLLRTLFIMLAPLLFFTTLRYLPLADATVVFFVTPLIATGLSVLFLKEVVGLHRWSAILVGFAGAVIALNPGTDVFQPIALFTLAAAGFYAGAMLIGRKLAGQVSVARLLLFQSLGLAIGFGLLGAPSWQPMPPEDLALTCLAAALSLVVMGCLTKGYMEGPPSVVGPFEYSALIWASTLGYWVWGDIPSLNVIGGGFLIIGAGIYILHRETRGKPPKPI